MAETPKIAERRVAPAVLRSLAALSGREWGFEILAGITLLAIAIPEQLATAQLAEVPSFLAIVAFCVAGLVFALVGSNPIMSVGADSTIAPLFAAALVKLAVPTAPDYLVVVAATAVVAGVLLSAVGLLKLGWVADFLSAPIVAGFMCGIGLTIIVHQLPNGLGLSGVSGTFLHRVGTIATHLSHVNGWTVLLAAATVAMVTIGEKWNPRVPFALLAVALTTIAVAVFSLGDHGVAVLGTVHAVGPSWRFGAWKWSQSTTVLTTGATVALVILSQSAATSRNVADEMGIDVNINRDFLALGLCNVATGICGVIPVNASPARTGVVRVAGGKTPAVTLVAAAGALAVAPMLGLLKDLPMAALAGVLFFVAARLIKVPTLRAIARVDRYEFGLAVITALAVILLGVQEGLGVAVGLAILDQLRRSARPHATVLGRRPDSTSWEAVGLEGSEPVDHVTTFLFSAPLYFANAALFRTEVHAALHEYPGTKHLVVDAAGMLDIDFTGLETLGSLVADLGREGIDVVLARTNAAVTTALLRAPSSDVARLRTFPTVDEAVRAVSD